jgi:MoxR-like ATPase
MIAQDTATLQPQAWLDRLRAAIGTVVVGKEEVVELMLVALLCEGHVLLEDVPGLGKTTLIRALAQALDCTFRRIQFTPDLLPTDVTGLTFFNQKHSEFQFRPGPVFANLLLADEINRATPRTQSALLEAMQERTVTLDGETHRLPRPFLVLATQNPVELEGTFPLPEAQLDRFLLRVELGYPSAEEEEQIVLRFGGANPLDSLVATSDQATLVAIQGQMRRTLLSAAVRQYAVAIVRATREHGDVELGASPRGSLALCQAAQALATLRGRAFVLPDDVKALVPAVLAHRLILSDEARLRGRTASTVLRDIVGALAVPVEV